MDEWPTLAAATGADAADAAPSPASGGGCAAWGAAAAQRGAAATAEQAVSRLVASCASSRGLAVAVVDANAAIAGGAALAAAAGRLVTVPEALEEVRDAAARRRLALLPAPIETVEPTLEFVKKVVKFARETGDLQTLSDVDIKIIALAYMLEAQIHGTSHLREHPPPLHVVNVRNLPEAQMPGWGSNVPNLSEWEALDQISEAGGDLNSRILPLKDLDNQEIPMSETNSVVETQGDEEHLSSKNDAGTACEKTVPHRINHSQREDTENEEGWFPAVSRSTHRRYLRRKARRDAINAFEESVDTGSTAPSVSDGNALSESNGNEFGMNPVDDPSAVQEQMKSNIDGFEHPEEENEPEVPGDHVDSDHPANGDTGTGNANTSEDGDEIDACSEELDNLEIKSETVGSVNTSFVDDRSSKQSWALRSLSESTVACVTSDYAMQNVILQIGLRLLAPGGMQIRQLHRWVLRCHACYKVTQEIGRIFCPKCGNGGTLRKVSVTVGENGITMAARRPRVILRGTKFSLPMPQGGREAITKNPVLREDQLPQKVLQLKSKKSSKKEENYLGADDIFSHSGEKRAPLKPPVRKALAMFSGKRNPNDNHFTRRKH